MTNQQEHHIRQIVASSVEIFARTFADRHLQEVDCDGGVINQKIHNIFIAVLGKDIQYYSALARSLDSSLGNMLEKMAVCIASINYRVSKHVEGVLYKAQTDFIAELLESYKNTKGSHHRQPSISDYGEITRITSDSESQIKRHESDYCLLDEETGIHYLIELKIGGDLDNKKARSEKEALLEQYCILSNTLGSSENVKIYFATAYNRFGEGVPWRQGRVRQFFADDELLISRDFWNFICKSQDGYEIVIDAYKRNAYHIVNALDAIKAAYLDD